MKNCNQCGKCCIQYADGGLSATTDEIEWWKVFRPDIYRYVKEGNIWVDPLSGRRLNYCPWLNQVSNQCAESSNKKTHVKYTCGIYHDRPEDCRQYPSSIEEMVRDECEMIEMKDLRHPKQAQKLLDTIMIDSRPPFSKN